MHFSNQLSKLIELLESAEELSMNNHQTSAQVQSPEDHVKQSGTAISIMGDEETTRLRNALQPLVKPGNGPISLKQLAKDMMDCLQMGSAATDAIREELINLLWEKDWKLNAFMVSTGIDANMTGHAIATGIHFSTIQTREDSIPKSFESTYSWIFQDDMPTQNSFPKWLDDDSKKVYWITGKPGSGKSTIMKMILNQKYLRNRLSESLGTLRLLLIKYYAWLSGQTLQKSIEGLKRTIIFQALEQYPDLAVELTPRRWAFCQVLRSTSGLPKWDTWEVDESFETLLSSCGKTIKLALFIDGLDELDTPPLEVIDFIQHLTARCPNGLKICAASRPWPEFLDEFSEGPMLEMHLQTENDMKIFVSENFQKNKGFVEQRELNPEEISQLFTDIVQRANGVFLWVSIVVQHLSDYFSEGQSVFQARQILETLPTDISSLYDAIWASIRPHNLPDASYMIQVLRAFEGPLPWLTLWLIEESRFTTINSIVIPETHDKILAAQRSLKRKLAARTKCILEISEDGQSCFVDFIHRTARDWAAQPNVWQLICSKSSGRFDPYLYILKGEIIDLSRYPPRTRRHDLELLTGVLRRATQVRDIPENESEFVNYLNLTNERFELILKVYQDPKWKHGSTFNFNFKTKTFAKNYGKNFLEVAAHFALLPYIKAVACSNPSRLTENFSGGSLSLLQRAIYGSEENMESFIDAVSCDQRLATVKYLLDQDVYQWRDHMWNNGIRNLKRQIQGYSKDYPANSEYFSTVAFLLDKKESELSVKTRILTFFEEMNAMLDK
ncbi:hypothetical protein CFAM422_010240 [Trichoderma lentiforme]|uniref:NACHT domain-containing protein n=1 Tax=Trichoderma lentiforme TaxID=1567552 RepID=A0A9P4X839_9HYPO|nr:hypothetical protein CFAM422_010240 [Trichoderma lentiforme]